MRARWAIAALRAYQWAVSPMLGPACRFEPSCSEYAAGAVGRHGIVRGAWLAARRLARCHPFGGMGYDPVPERAPGVRNGASSRSEVAGGP